MAEPPRVAFARWLAGLPWRYYFNGTFREEGMPRDRAAAKWREFVAGVDHTLKADGFLRPSFWVVAYEEHPRRSGGGTHAHALMGNMGRIWAKDMSQSWRSSCGVVWTEPVRSALLVAGYLGKYVVKGGDVEFSEQIGRWFDDARKLRGDGR